MYHEKREPVWHVELAVLCAIALQLVLADKVTIGPRYVIAGLEAFLLVVLAITRHDSLVQKSGRLRRMVGLVLTGLISLANITSLILVINYLLTKPSHTDGKTLIFSAVAIFLTNIIVFGLWYWQLDGGGPGGRGTHLPPVDFLFPQKNTPAAITEQPNWQPTFFDYLYVSITNGTAFSPTDTLPITHRAKFLMSLQGITSLLTIALVAARAINILG